MKVKHIITTCGILLSGIIVAQGASATVTYETGTEVQFSFSPVLSLELYGEGFVIDGLVPGVSADSNEVEAKVSTNNAAGYTLSATVGNDTYNSINLISGTDEIAMMGNGTSLTPGTWGYKIKRKTDTNYGNYGRLDRATSTIINKTTNMEGSAATGYIGSNSTMMKVGAYAATSQPNGTYRNAINFAAVTNVATHVITLVAGSNVSSVVLGSSGTSDTYSEGDTVTITATCNSGHVFNSWNRSVNYGVLADFTSASTTYRVGGGDVVITAYCQAE